MARIPNCRSRATLLAAGGIILETGPAARATFIELREGALERLFVQLFRGNHILMGIVGTIPTGSATGVGALPVLFTTDVSERVLDALLGFAAGVMLAVTAFSLNVPVLALTSCLCAGPVARSSSALSSEKAFTATVYYVRPDGGSAEQCTGRVDTPYPGNGSNQPCAWDHPFRALEPSGEPSVASTARIAAGDTLIIASGSYRVGYGAPGAGNCQSDYRWDCHMPPVPSGPDPAHATRILAEGWDSGCVNPPELWGAERAPHVLNLTDASNVEVTCLEITDHSECVDGHTGELACKRDAYPYGNRAADGLCADNFDSHPRDAHPDLGVYDRQE